jgi:hypothetical protein
MRRLTGRRALATLPGLLLLAACATVPPPPTAAIAPARDLPAAALADRLPAEAAGFERGTTVPLRQGEDGRETSYRTQGRIAAGATVDLYRQAGASVPEGIGSPAADTAFEQLVQAATRPSPHRHLRAQGEFALPAPGPAPGGGPASAALRCAETTGVYGRERVQGLLCAGGVGGGLLQLRVTMPQRDPLPADARAFATAILAALRTP